MSLNGEKLQVAVELMDDPCLWRWEIRDPSRGRVVADSWTRDWTAYESREEAYRAGQARLRAFQPPEQ
jgi:hypothetical protein